MVGVLLALSLAVGCSRQSKLSGESNTPPSGSVSIELAAGDNRVTIKPGETADLPPTTINVLVRFSTAVDWYSVAPTVQPVNWHVEAKNRVPEANVYNFLLRPDSGASGPVTITIDGVKGADGKPVLKEPIIFYVHTSPKDRAWKQLMAGGFSRPSSELPPIGVYVFQTNEELSNWQRQYHTLQPDGEIDFSKYTVAIVVLPVRTQETIVKTVEIGPNQAVVVLAGSGSEPPGSAAGPAGQEARRVIAIQLPKVAEVVIREEDSPLKQYTPVKLALTDYQGTVRDLLTDPDEAVAAGVRALGGRVDYGSPPIAPVPGYELTLKGPKGEEAVLRYVGDGNWRGPSDWFEGKVLANAVQSALAPPNRRPGDLEYLFEATELKVSQNSMNIPDELWNRRRQVVVRVLRELGTPKDDNSVPLDEPLRLSFTVQGRTEQVEVWVDAFRYGGKMYYAQSIMWMLGSNMAAG
jgi:hypothetical protein